MARGRRAIIADEDDEDGVVPAQVSAQSQRAPRRYRRGTQDVADASQANDRAGDEVEAGPASPARRPVHQTTTEADDDGGRGLFQDLTQRLAEDQVEDASDEDDDESKWAEWAARVEGHAPLVPESVAIVLGEQKTQWDKVHRFVVDSSRLLGNAAAFSEEQARGDGLSQSDHYDTLDAFARKLSDVVAKSKLRIRTLDRLQQSVGSEIDHDLAGTYRQTAATLDEGYEASTSRQKYAAEDSDVYSYFRTLAWDASHPETEPMPALKELLPAEEGDENDSDDDLQMGGVMVSFKCPLTQDYLANPVKNPACQHVFSKDAIVQHLRTNRSGRCPVSGCTATIRPNDLVDDPLMARRTAMHLRRMKTGAASNNAAAELID